MAWRRRKDILPKGSLNESVSDEAVYRTALATPGLLKILGKTRSENSLVLGEQVSHLDIIRVDQVRT